MRSAGSSLPSLNTTERSLISFTLTRVLSLMLPLQMSSEAPTSM
jgi:hypothetical protein